MTSVRSALLAFFLNVTMCLCGWSALPIATASAQTGYLSTEDSRLQYVPPTPTHEELQREYDSIRLWGPAIGIPVSYFTIVGGFAPIVAANLDWCSPPSCVDEPHTASEKAMIGVGSVLIIAGVAGFIASIVRVHQKRERKRKLRYEMGQLRFGT